MQVVINISEEIYEELNKNSWNSCFVDNELAALEQAFCNSIVLPKNHGRLIDEKTAYKKFYCQNLAKVAKEVLDDVPTIIPAEDLR